MLSDSQQDLTVHVPLLGMFNQTPSSLHHSPRPCRSRAMSASACRGICTDTPSRLPQLCVDTCSRQGRRRYHPASTGYVGRGSRCIPCPSRHGRLTKRSHEQLETNIPHSDARQNHLGFSRQVVHLSSSNLPKPSQCQPSSRPVSVASPSRGRRWVTHWSRRHQQGIWAVDNARRSGLGNV